MIPAKAGGQIRFTAGNVSILISLMPMAARMSHARYIRRFREGSPCGTNLGISWPAQQGWKAAMTGGVLPVGATESLGL